MKLFHSSCNFGITILRITIGVIFLLHGYQKLFTMGVSQIAEGFTKMGMPMPYLNACLASGAEFFCGLLLILGLLTRLASIPLVIVMIVAFATVHGKNGFFLQHQGFEYVLALFAANLALVFLGSGPLAIDKLIASRGAGPETRQTPISARPATP